MNKQEAIQSMLDGNKVTHRYFSNNEWVTMNEQGEIISEDGVNHGLYFWKIRSHEDWETDWSIYNEAETTVFHRPKTRGELMNALRENKPCEVVASNEEITSVLIRAWASDIKFKTKPSENEGWVIYEKLN